LVPVQISRQSPSNPSTSFGDFVTVSTISLMDAHFSVYVLLKTSRSQGFEVLERAQRSKNGAMVFFK